MKKVMLICMVITGLALTSCNYINPSSKNGSLTEENSRHYSPEAIEWANQYHFNIDTTKVYNLDIKVFQTISDNECLASERSDSRYKWYDGQLMYYMTSDMIYDDKIIKEKAYLLGTYRYKTVDTIRQYKVVPLYCETQYYETLKEEGVFDLIKEVQEN